MTKFVIKKERVNEEGELVVKIPQGVTEIEVESDKNTFGKNYLKILPSLPESLLSLNLYRCKGLQSLPQNLPKSLLKLNLSGCENLESLPTELPEDLEEISLLYCPKITSLPDNLPKKLKLLSLIDLKDLQSLTQNLPEGLLELDLSECGNLKSLAQNLPQSLQIINLNGCQNLQSLPENLPESLEELSLHGCLKLQSFPQILPQVLQKLDLSFCAGLEFLPENLPEGLQKLNLDCCVNLQFLPENLPQSLQKLDLSRCSKLIPSPQLIERLEQLEENGCEVSYPNHFSFGAAADAAKEELSNLIAEYKTQTKSTEAFNGITDIFHRFLTEGISQRSSATKKSQQLLELVTALNPILNLIEKNPSHLVWMDEISSQFLAGCVNQPVAGVSEISALVGIANAKDEDKLEAAKHLKAVGIIKELVATSDPKPGLHVEVEAGNALLREVHKKLLEEGKITKPWLGVAGPIAYEATISSWLNQELIDNACDFVIKESLDKPISEIANYLCETNHRSAWFNIAFSEQLDAINDKHNNKQTALTIIQEVLNGETSKDEMEGEAKSARCLTELREILSDQKNGEEFNVISNPKAGKDHKKIEEFIKKIYEEINLQKDKEIAEVVISLTEQLAKKSINEKDEPDRSPSPQETKIPWGKREKDPNERI